MTQFAVLPEQAGLFLSTVLAGLAAGLFFDFFRILRKTTPILAKSKIFVQIEDFIFWLIVTGGVFYFMLSTNYGEIRLFSMLGVGLGALIYFATFSRLIIYVCVGVVNYMKKVIATALRIIFTPMRILKNWLSPHAKKLYKKIRSGLFRVKRYGRIRAKKTAQNLFILRKKV